MHFPEAVVGVATDNSPLLLSDTRGIGRAGRDTEQGQRHEKLGMARL